MFFPKSLDMVVIVIIIMIMIMLMLDEYHMGSCDLCV